MRDLENITALGVDEVAYKKGHHYMTLVYQIDKGKRRLLGVVEGRRVKSLLRFFRDFGKEVSPAWARTRGWKSHHNRIENGK